MKYDYSLKNDYYTQRNNLKVPFTACSRTSTVMALNQSGWVKEVEQLEFKDISNGIQPEDFLSSISDFRGPIERLKQTSPWFFKDGKLTAPAHQIPQILVESINYLFGNGVATLMEYPSYNLDFLINKLKHGYGIALFGKIKQPNGKILRHVVSLAGYEEVGGEIVNMIIDDPYGVYKTNYTYHCGNNVIVPIAEFMEFFFEKYLWHVLIAPRKNYL
jgi:hypothetical protein